MNRIFLFLNVRFWQSIGMWRVYHMVSHESIPNICMVFEVCLWRLTSTPIRTNILFRSCNQHEEWWVLYRMCPTWSFQDSSLMRISPAILSQLSTSRNANSESRLRWLRSIHMGKWFYFLCSLAILRKANISVVWTNRHTRPSLRSLLDCLVSYPSEFISTRSKKTAILLSVLNDAGQHVPIIQ